MLRKYEGTNRKAFIREKMVITIGILVRKLKRSLYFCHIHLDNNINSLITKATWTQALYACERSLSKSDVELKDLPYFQQSSLLIQYIVVLIILFNKRVFIKRVFFLKISSGFSTCDNIE